jgi:hypothetical protein
VGGDDQQASVGCVSEPFGERGHNTMTLPAGEGIDGPTSTGPPHAAHSPRPVGACLGSAAASAGGGRRWVRCAGGGVALGDEARLTKRSSSGPVQVEEEAVRSGRAPRRRVRRAPPSPGWDELGDALGGLGPVALDGTGGVDGLGRVDAEQADAFAAATRSITTVSPSTIDTMRAVPAVRPASVVVVHPTPTTRHEQRQDRRAGGTGRAGHDRLLVGVGDRWRPAVAMCAREGRLLPQRSGGLRAAG